MSPSSSLYRASALAALLIVLALFRVSAIERIAQTADPVPPVSAVAAHADASSEPDMGLSPFVITGGLVPDTVFDEPDNVLARTPYSTPSGPSRF